MATILKAGNVASGAQITSDSTGILEIKTGTGAGTTAMTLGADQTVTFAAGTTVNSLTTSGAVSAGSLTVNSNNISAVNSLGFRNRIINGDCRIDQRNNGASVTPTTAATAFAVDRTGTIVSQNSKLTVQQNAGSVTPPAGFSNYLGVTSSSAYSVLSSDYFNLNQTIEGFNIADLGWGTANAQTITLSFWVRSSLTGTHSGSLRNGAANRTYVFTFAVSSANTWEYKTVTVAGDTSGTWQTGNGSGVFVSFNLGAGSTFASTAGSWGAGNFIGATGSVSVVGTNGATFYITGVQLEAGSVATPFERRDYGRELIMCQRYCLVDTNESKAFASFAIGGNSSSTASALRRYFPVTMRAAPTLTVSSTTTFLVDQGNVAPATTNITLGVTTSSVAALSTTVASGLTAGFSSTLVSDATTSPRSITYSAEL
jgi:hypothetical protein